MRWLRISASAGNPEPKTISETASMRGSGWEKIEATRFAGISELRNRACSELSSTLASAIAMATASRLPTGELANGFRGLLAAELLRRVTP